MLGRRPTLLMVTALSLGVAAGCSKKQPPATDDRGRVEPPPATEPAANADADAARRAEEEARLAREAAYGSIQDMIYFDFDRSIFARTRARRFRPRPRLCGSSPTSGSASKGTPTSAARSNTTSLWASAGQTLRGHIWSTWGSTRIA